MNPPSLKKLVVLSAPSGSGKSTLATMLLQQHDASIQPSISFTTRSPRGEEKHGVHYFFVTEKKFQEMIKQHHFLEYAHVFGKHWYGTSKTLVEGLLDRDKNVLFDIDVQGAMNLKRKYTKQCVTVFVLPPSLEELEKRLRNRKTDSQKSIEMRLKTAREELSQASKFDYQIMNQNIHEAFLELEGILKKEGCF